MTTEQNPVSESPIFISSSRITTQANKTGSWRFLTPRYSEKTAPCSAACPTGEDIGLIQMLTAQGLFKEAWETILKENPFPGVCGRVCFHPCEKICNRSAFDDAISIRTIERFLSDSAARNELTPHMEKPEPQKQKVAVIGAGPAGLSAAYFLYQLGYTCDVFEARSEPGGVLRWGLPQYRLPKKILEREISQITALGIRIHCNRKLSESFFEEDRFDAVFVACGTWKMPALKIPGEDLEGIVDGLSFLEQVVKCNVSELKGTVGIIGGGNTAVDVARAVIRLGGKAVICYRRRQEDMPAFEEEIHMALEEGVEIRELLSPLKIGRKEQGFSVTFGKMKVTGTEESGRATVETDEDATESLDFSHLFKAIGFVPEEPWYLPPTTHETFQILGNCRMWIRKRGRPFIYGGDLSTPVNSVVHAIASGKEAAMAIDAFFRKGVHAIPCGLESASVGSGGTTLSMELYKNGDRSQREPHVVAYNEINTDHFEFSARLVQPRLLKEERVVSFAEIDLKISANLAMGEAERCFNCGLCNQCDNCRLFCPDMAVIYDASNRKRTINYDYCKGCGICVVECPRNAMKLTEEDLT